MDIDKTMLLAHLGMTPMEFQLKTYDQWLQAEHDRLHIVEDWPESAYKRATIAAIHSAMRSLLSYRSARSSPGPVGLDFSDAGAPSHGSGWHAQLGLRRS